VLLEEFVKQHRVHCFIADSVELALFIFSDQVRIDLGYIFGDQAELWNSVRV
jgi:hypothetical protein